ncbi:unnamed protein product [Caenorhabditis nigoni]
MEREEQRKKCAFTENLLLMTTISMEFSIWLKCMTIQLPFGDAKCLSEITTISDIQSTVSSDPKEMDVQTAMILLQKSLSFSNK